MAAALVAATALTTACDAPPTEPGPSAVQPVTAAQTAASDFPVVIVRQGAGTGEATDAGEPVVDNLADALDRVASGGTVRVQPGTYVVDQLDLLRPVTVVGVGGTATLTPSDPTATNTRAFNIVADGNTTIGNLHFTGYTSPILVNEFGVSDPYDLVVIEDVHIELGDGFTSGVSALPGVNPPDGRTIIVRNSTIEGGWRGLHVQNDVPNFVAVGNRMIGQNVDGAHAIAFSEGASGRIEGNEVTSCVGCINVGGGSLRGDVEIIGNHVTASIDLPSDNLIAASVASVEIRDNVVEGIGGVMDPNDPSTWPIPSNAIVIEGAVTGELHGNRVSGAWTAYSIGHDIGQLTALDNVADGVQTGLLSFSVAGSLTFQSSDFTNYHRSLHVDDPSGMDLTCNWWGTAAGPQNISGQINDPSVFTPWATEPVAGTSTTTCSGGL